MFHWAKRSKIQPQTSVSVVENFRRLKTFKHKIWARYLNASRRRGHFDSVLSVFEDFDGIPPREISK
jgi:hypothetical protein